MAFIDIRKSAAILALTLVAMAAHAPSAMAALKNENLLATIPDGFKVGFQTRSDREIMAEYVPAQESVDDWSRMITVQIFHALKMIDPDAFAGGVAKGWMSACAGGDARKVTAGKENGYAFSVWMYNCPLNPRTGKPENMWLKATSGVDALYSVQYAYRKAMSADLIGPAMDYLQHVSVCDTRLADRRCPDGM
ncbi:hypothetical protein [Methylocapsa sp. S129]|uniref:hypothetical protein n=1 Tax=Methylocapsa sp. S129 TaxID=1641869 RepID=UPI00131C1ED3|nr:hypothetical protein [Methylocapsa sp. S129]